MATMNVSLPDDLARQVESFASNGRYSSASEVVRAALRMMFEREAHLEWLRAEVRKGFEEIDRGEGIPFNEELVEQIKSEGRKRFEERKNRESA